jgi:putative glutathione S-transferase
MAARWAPYCSGDQPRTHIKRHYFGTHPHLNPSRIVPAGPILDWDAPHDRSTGSASSV